MQIKLLNRLFQFSFRAIQFTINYDYLLKLFLCRSDFRIATKHIVSRESECPPTFEVVGYLKIAAFKPQRSEHMKYKHTHC